MSSVYTRGSSELMTQLYTRSTTARREYQLPLISPILGSSYGLVLDILVLFCVQSFIIIAMLILIASLFS